MLWNNELLYLFFIIKDELPGKSLVLRFVMVQFCRASFNSVPMYLNGFELL